MNLVRKVVCLLPQSVRVTPFESAELADSDRGWEAAKELDAAIKERDRFAISLWAHAAEIAAEAILKNPDQKELYLDRLRRYQPYA